MASEAPLSPESNPLKGLKAVLLPLLLSSLPYSKVRDLSLGSNNKTFLSLNKEIKEKSFIARNHIQTSHELPDFTNQSLTSFIIKEHSNFLFYIVLLRPN